MSDDHLKNIDEQLNNGVIPPKETVRGFLLWFGAGRRGYNVVRHIRGELEKFNLETKPDFEVAYIDERCLMIDRTALGVLGAGAEEFFYYHTNNLYSVAALTNAAGAPVERYAYDAYGNPIILDALGLSVLPLPATGNPHLYTGRRLDEETGLYYYRSRYYSASLGRFISRDRINYWGGDANLYRYVGDNPAYWLDPYGCGWWDDLNYTISYIFIVSSPDGARQRERHIAMLNASYGYEKTNYVVVLDCVQGVLDVVGFIPVVGEIADATNGVIYLARGDVPNAVISAGAMLPIGGQAFTGTRVTVRATRAVLEATAQRMRASKKDRHNLLHCLRAW